jgi:hypothetical protein
MYQIGNAKFIASCRGPARQASLPISQVASAIRSKAKTFTESASFCTAERTAQIWFAGGDGIPSLRLKII